jgi:hypothetical protein
MKKAANVWKITIALAIVATCAIAYSISVGNSNESDTMASLSAGSDAACSDVHKGDAEKTCPHSKGDFDEGHPHGGDAEKTCPHNKSDLSDKEHTDLPEGHPEIN